METATVFEILKWVLPTVVAPLLGWAGGVFAIRRSAKRRKKVLISNLSGLPYEAKAVLIDFYMQRTHTQRGDPGAPVIRLLVEEGVLKVGPGGGTYDAIDRYLSIVPQVWEVMDDWVVVDIGLLELFQPAAEEAAH